jgi:hypothetical protein
LTQLAGETDLEQVLRPSPCKRCFIINV